MDDDTLDTVVAGMPSPAVSRRSLVAFARLVDPEVPQEERTLVMLPVLDVLEDENIFMPDAEVVMLLKVVTYLNRKDREHAQESVARGSVANIRFNTGFWVTELGSVFIKTEMRKWSQIQGITPVRTMQVHIRPQVVLNDEEERDVIRTQNRASHILMRMTDWVPYLPRGLRFRDIDFYGASTNITMLRRVLEGQNTFTSLEFLDCVLGDRIISLLSEVLPRQTKLAKFVISKDMTDNIENDQNDERLSRVVDSLPPSTSFLELNNFEEFGSMTFRSLCRFPNREGMKVTWLFVDDVRFDASTEIRRNVFYNKVLPMLPDPLNGAPCSSSLYMRAIQKIVTDAAEWCNQNPRPRATTSRTAASSVFELMRAMFDVSDTRFGSPERARGLVRQKREEEAEAGKKRKKTE